MPAAPMVVGPEPPVFSFGRDQIVGMGTAFALAGAEMGTESERIRILQRRLLDGIADIEQVFEFRVGNTNTFLQPDSVLTGEKRAGNLDRSKKISLLR